ncbi:MAG: hypothetical protein J7480_06370 [Microbacteriaceae bacterium]|nr:hypothetical protein [Microbacteriaceae bacterium]
MQAAAPARPEVPEVPEHRWPAFLAIAAVVAADAALPSAFGAVPRIVVPVVAGVLALALLVYNPHRFNRETSLSRAASIGIAVLLAVWNQVEVVATIGALIDGAAEPRFVLLQALRVWFTNVLVYALIYWELDRDGPVARRLPPVPGVVPDFRFPQEEVASFRGWRPSFIDYAFFSLSNMMAFSPTDAMPMRGRAKALMALQAFTGFVLLALVISRAVNILA